MLNSFQHLTKSITQTLKSQTLNLIQGMVQGDKKRITKQPFRGEDVGGLFNSIHNSRGLSVLFLVFAMLLMVTIGYVFSYLIPTKQKSVRFPIYSNQAFFIAQSGVEYAIRYGSDQGWGSTTDLLRLNNPGVNQRNLGNGGITINYSNVTDTLTSDGEITGSTEKRVIKVSQMSQFLRLIYDPASPAPCWCFGTRMARFYIKNVGSNIVTLTAFSGTWTQPPPARMINRIDMAGNQKFNGNYSSGDPITNFNRPAGSPSQTINPGETIEVLIRWNANTNATNIVMRFYTALGDMFTFNLDPEGDGLPICAVGC